VCLQTPADLASIRENDDRIKFYGKIFGDRDGRRLSFPDNAKDCAMVYLNVGKSSNRSAAPRTRRDTTLVARKTSRLAHLALAFCFMLVIAAALVAHGIVVAVSSTLRGSARNRHAGSSQDRARYVPAYPSSLS
jgi:hypothetical protein